MCSFQDTKKVKSNFLWDEDRINFYLRAAEYTGYNQEISKIIGREIGKNREVWDLGCGISDMSLGLNTISKNVICVDICSLALENLSSITERKALKNVKTVNMDYEDFLIKNGPGDCIIVSHFLDMNESIDFLLNNCKTLIIIKNSEKRKTKYLRAMKKQTIEDIEENILNKRYGEIEYKKIIYSGDFGQPLKDLEEAVKYFESYSKKSIDVKEIKEILIKTKDKKYPYYLPKKKSTGILIIKGRG